MMSLRQRFYSGLSLATIQTPLILDLTCYKISDETH